MPEEQQHAEVLNDSVAPQLITGSETVTQDSTMQSSDDLNISHDEMQTNETSEESIPTTLSNTQEPTIDVLKKEYGKLKETQKELKASRQEKEALIGWTLKTPERTREYLIETEGKSPEEADRVIAHVRVTNPQLWGSSQNGQQNNAQQAPDPYVIAQQVVQKTLEEREYVDRFFKAVPELSPKTVKNDEEKQSFIAMSQKVDYIARSFLAAKPEADLETLWMDAYKYVTGRSDEDITHAREEGRYEGMQIANGQKAASFSSSTPSSATRKGVPNLSNEQKHVADLMIAEGIVKDYAEYLENSQD